MYYYLNLFFIFSILGYFVEQGVLTFIGEKYNSSLLIGPWTIVYGIASLIIIYIWKKIAKLSINKFLKFLIFVITSFFVLSLLELIAGILIEKTLGIVYWDYTNMPLNIGKYICVIISLIWSLYAIVINYLVYPRIKDFIKKIPRQITIILIILFIFDVGYSIINYFKYV